MSYDEHLISMAGGDGELDLDAIEARAQAATEGPWLINDREQTVRVIHPEGGMWLGEIMFDRSGEDYLDWTNMFRRDAEFIANARTDIPALLAIVRQQQDKLDRVLELAYWAGKRGWQIAPATLRNTINEEGK